jgi:two-component system cell cycle response regulator
MLTRLLVIDDDIKVVKSMVALAAARGYTATGVSDPAEIAARLHDFCPDVILLDLQMGPHDGRDVLRKIKTDAEMVDAIVIIISAVMDPFTIDLCRGYGAADYICKPFYPSELFERLQRIRNDRAAHA